mmetsp:Transcript_35035/g.53738  ORF Transcript_35035/g.53738 Transcript_35035/m.53738 type:complete len:80 (-) Transcript_35035:214-453(-)
MVVRDCRNLNTSCIDIFLLEGRKRIPRIASNSVQYISFMLVKRKVMLLLCNERPSTNMFVIDTIHDCSQRKILEQHSRV